MSGGTILVTGGTGKTGGRLAARLVEAGARVRVGSRSGAAPAGAEAARFDWFSPEGHDAALEGIGEIVAEAIDKVGKDGTVTVEESNTFGMDLEFVEGMQFDKGYISAYFVTDQERLEAILEDPYILILNGKISAVHALLRARAPEWAVLRPSWFMENFTIDPHLASIRGEDAIYSATDDGQAPFIAADDIAAVASRALTSERSIDDGVILTGPEAISYAQVAEAIGAARGKAVRHISLDAEALAARLAQFGIPEPFAAMLAGLDRAIAQGAEARTTDAVRDMAGHVPRTFGEFASDNAPLWRTRSSTVAEGRLTPPSRGVVRT